MDHARYTLSDRCAQARALGISYGQLISLFSSGAPLPPLQRPIIWPEGSAHAGETQVFRGWPQPEYPGEYSEPVPWSLQHKFMGCGTKTGATPSLYLKYRDWKKQYRSITLGYLCDKCARPILRDLAPGLEVL